MIQRLQDGIAHGKLFYNIFQYNDICHANPSFHYAAAPLSCSLLRLPLFKTADRPA